MSIANETCALSGSAHWIIDVSLGSTSYSAPLLFPGVTSSVLSVVVPSPPTLRLYDISSVEPTPDLITTRPVTELDVAAGYGVTGQYSYVLGVTLTSVGITGVTFNTALVIYNGGTALNFVDCVRTLPGQFSDGGTSANVVLGEQSFGETETFPWCVQSDRYIFFPARNPVNGFLTLVALDVGGTGNTPGYPTVVLYQSTGVTADSQSNFSMRQQIAVSMPMVYISVGSIIQAYEVFAVPQFQSLGATLRSTIDVSSFYSTCSVGATGTQLHVVGSQPGMTGAQYRIYSFATPTSPVFLGGCTIAVQSDSDFDSVRSISMLPGNLAAVSIFTGIVIVNVDGITAPFFQQLFGGIDGGETTLHFMNSYESQGLQNNACLLSLCTKQMVVADNCICRCGDLGPTTRSGFRLGIDHEFDRKQFVL